MRKGKYFHFWMILVGDDTENTSSLLSDEINLSLACNMELRNSNYKTGSKERNRFNGITLITPHLVKTQFNALKVSFLILKLQMNSLFRFNIFCTSPLK